MDQIAKGLELFGICQAVRAEPNIGISLFTITESELLKWNPEEFIGSTVVEYSETGSNRRIKEVDTYKAFTDAVESIFHDGKYQTKPFFSMESS